MAIESIDRLKAFVGINNSTTQSDDFMLAQSKAARQLGFVMHQSKDFDLAFHYFKRHFDSLLIIERQSNENLDIPSEISEHTPRKHTEILLTRNYAQEADLDRVYMGITKGSLHMSSYMESFKNFDRSNLHQLLDWKDTLVDIERFKECNVEIVDDKTTIW